MLDALIKGGWVMLPLVVCSLTAVAVSIEKLLFLRRISISDHADKVVTFVMKEQLNEALTISQGTQSPLLHVLSAGIAQRCNSSKAMEAAAIVEVDNMKRGLPILDTIITLSPLLGLLGTIIGMISSFQVMSVAGMGQPHAVTGGIAEALIATATGIIVAIVTLIPYNYFLARIERETTKIEHYATRLEMALDTPFYRSDKHEDIKKFA
ncbi:MotA/TolQ/ExbB proton channel family protein [Pelosinus sp. sgz500959]|uniref:MotA/TolQ/ExbB proton channel family protein n=1 Tax=Pelosinus sp. sgz500959 TaxID=3242472 RepID=UPI00366E930C